jgi:shikimate kinase
MKTRGMKNIVLVGFMGTGKTTVGKLISKHLNMKFISTDKIIENREGMLINEIFSVKGEPYFREVERDVVKEVSKKENSVIDTGGGVIINKLNVKDLKKNGFIFCLNATPKDILKRTKRYTHRPLLNVAEPETKIKDLMEKRREYYKRADYQIETTGKNPTEVFQEIIKIYKDKLSKAG